MAITPQLSFYVSRMSPGTQRCQPAKSVVKNTRLVPGGWHGISPITAPVAGSQTFTVSGLRNGPRQIASALARR